MPRRPQRLAPTPAWFGPFVELFTRLGLQVEKVAMEARAGTDAVRADAVITLRGPKDRAEWACEHKTRLERATLGPTIHHLVRLREQVGRALLLTEHVTPPIADELRAQGLGFVDLAGNAFLQDEGLLVWVTGRPRVARAGVERRALHAAGTKLLCVLLHQRRHEGTLRDLADEAGIALGGVARILREFERRAWIRRVKDGFEMQDPDAMLKRWDEGYADTLRPKLFETNCRRRPGGPLERIAETIAKAELGEKILVGGELGAALLTKYLRPETATLHLDGIEPKDAMRALDLVPDPEGDVALVRAFGRVDVGTARKTAALADPLWIHAELLLRPDDRLRDVAEKVRIDHVEPRWK
ncbi:MAG: hypothetical protein IPJ77_17435 [Planctomycetes bacterium]|nr:hypothetical protein [Planctomycetota bacterium]